MKRIVKDNQDDDDSKEFSKSMTRFMTEAEPEKKKPIINI